MLLYHGAYLPLLSLAFFAVGGCFALFFYRRPLLAHWLGALGAVAGGIWGFVFSLLHLDRGVSLTLPFVWPVAGGNLSLRLDPLAFFFLCPVFLLVAVTSLYAAASFSPAKENQGQRRNAGHWFFVNLLAASMALVLSANHGLVFLVAWECMSLSSFFLVVHDFKNEEVRKAGWIYLMATHLGAACLFLFFLEAGRLAGGMDFAQLAALGTLATVPALGLFFLLLAGFGSKAGLFPLHVWLPEAHPAAPSHISALMSGVMIKTAIYGLLRLGSFLPPPPAWCGVLLLVLGALGAAFGIAMAFLQEDIKRLLAYSSVENIGIIFFSLGLWMYAKASALPLVALLALCGALLHVWNHSLFKGLLFLGAGSLVHATGTRTLSRMGGLWRRMPLTGAAILLGAVAITALPPANGFISELIIWLGIFHAGQMSAGAGAFFFLVLTALFALVCGLALAVFSRLTGVALLGEARQQTGAPPHEAPPAELAAMGILAAGCLYIGLFPALPLDLVLTAAAAVAGGPPAAMQDTGPLPLPFSTAWSVGATLGLIVLVLFLRARYRTQERKVRTWGCGFPSPSPRMAYSAGSFSQMLPAILLWKKMRPRTRWNSLVDIFPPAATFREESQDPVLAGLFFPLFRRLADQAHFLHALQAGQMNLYIFYMFAAIISLLCWIFLSP